MLRSSTRVPASRQAQVARASRAVILASFLNNLGFNFIFPLVPLYMRELAGPGPATAIWSGVALAASPLGGAIAAPIWGRQADRIGYRPMMLRTMLSTSILIAAMVLPNAPWQLVLLRFLSGAAGSLQGMGMGALGAWNRPEDLSRAISRLQMAQVCGVVVGALLGGAVAAVFGIRFAPLAGGLCLGLGTLLVARWLHGPDGKPAALKGLAAPFRLSYIWLPIVMLLAVQFTDSSFNPILPLLLAQSADAASVAGLTGIAASLSATAAAVCAGMAGQLMRKGPRHMVVLAATAVLAVLALSAIAAPLPWGVIGLRVLCGGVVAGVSVAAYSAGGLMVEPHQRGAAYGWLASAGMVGFGVSPIVAGLLAAIDLRAVLVLDALLCLAGTGAWAMSRRAVPAPAANVVEKRLIADVE